MPQISKSKSWGQLFWGGSCTDRRTSTGQHTGPVGSCELMLASTDLQLQLLAGQEQKALLPFPSSFQWELVWPWPNSPGWGQPRVGQMYFITQTFSLFIFDYCTPATQTTEESEKNTEGKKKKKQSFLRGRLYICTFSSYSLGRDKTHFEWVVIEKLQYFIWKQNRGSSYLWQTAFLSNEDSTDIVCVVQEPFIYY